MAKRTVKILSIDGGGIRGIIPARILAELEEKTGKPVSALFDLVAGTSAGGIIALGLSKPSQQEKPAYTALDVLSFFESKGPVIFSRSFLKTILSAGGLVDEKYPSSRIDSVLREYFGDTKLHEALVPILIPSYEIERRSAFFFKSKLAGERKNRDFLMRDVARATSAAPTYFEPLKTEALKNDYYTFVDGGVFANNPALCAWVEAKKMYPDSDVLIVSLGTGELTERIRYEQAKNWGMASWARPILSVVFDGINDTIDYQLRKLLPVSNGFSRYYRFQATLPAYANDLDNAQVKNTRVLKLLAEDIIKTRHDDIARLCRQLQTA